MKSSNGEKEKSHFHDTKTGTKLHALNVTKVDDNHHNYENRRKSNF